MCVFGIYKLKNTLSLNHLLHDLVIVLYCMWMDAEFDDADLADLERNIHATARHGAEVDRGFRKVMQYIRAAKDERDFYEMKSLHFEKLKGARKHQCSLKINKQWRLIVEIRTQGNRKLIGIISIEDYH